MKLKYILITAGSMLLLFGIMYFITYTSKSYRIWAIAYSVLGLGTLLSGIFWKKQ